MSSWSGWSAASYIGYSFERSDFVSDSFCTRPRTAKQTKRISFGREAQAGERCPYTQNPKPNAVVAIVEHVRCSCHERRRVVAGSSWPQSSLSRQSPQVSVAMSTTAVSTMVTITIAITVTVPVTYDSITILLLSCLMLLRLFVYLVDCLQRKGSGNARARIQWKTAPTQRRP